jgi:hypothetical protein
MSNPRAKHRKPGVREEYRTRNTVGLKPFDVQAVGAHIYQIRSREGGVQPKAVLDEARDINSVLHAPFEWDDGVAAEYHRLWQARKLIRNVVLVRIEENLAGEMTEQEVPLVHVPASGDHPARYESADTLVSDADAWSRAYQDALQALRLAQRRVAELEAMTHTGDHAEQASVLRVALKGLETAHAALERLH